MSDASTHGASSQGNSTHSASAHGNGHSEPASGPGHHGDEIAHVTPVRLLLGVWGALMVLTVITVAATSIDLGSRTNLIIAMLIATVKAGLVVTYFMHLRWDRPFHTLVFLGSLLFVSLFISMTLFDKSEYEPDIEEMYLQKGQ
jgi:cytochrome c oxidase subunit 4